MPKAPASLRDRALAYLARREHSRLELTRKLQQAGFPAEDIALVLDDFEKRNWLSDQRFAASYVADHQVKFGAIKLAYELQMRGISDAIIKEILQASPDSEQQRAQTIWQKKFGTPPATPQEKARQLRFMQSRGFNLNSLRSLFK